ncbi:MAG: Crp/Fnr family transcriptional regulator [Pseudomonadota bacterium]
MICDLDHKHVTLPSPFDSLKRGALFQHEAAVGEAVFRQGDRAEGMFFVLSGEIELRRHTSAGTEVVLHRASTGETFAEASLFAEKYHCDAVASSDSKLVRFDRKAVLRKMENDSTFAMEIAARFAKDVQAGRRQVELLNVRSARERVHIALSDGWLTGSVVAFARRIGLTQEATYRALAELVDAGSVRKAGRGRYEPCSPQRTSRPTPAKTS